jgi:hypothetical protein
MKSQHRVAKDGTLGKDADLFRSRFIRTVTDKATGMKKEEEVEHSFEEDMRREDAMKHLESYAIEWNRNYGEKWKSDPKNNVAEMDEPMVEETKQRLLPATITKIQKKLGEIK